MTMYVMNVTLYVAHSSVLISLPFYNVLLFTCVLLELFPSYPPSMSLVIEEDIEIY